MVARAADGAGTYEGRQAALARSAPDRAAGADPAPRLPWRLPRGLRSGGVDDSRAPRPRGLRADRPRLYRPVSATGRRGGRDRLRPAALDRPDPRLLVRLGPAVPDAALPGRPRGGAPLPRRGGPHRRARRDPDSHSLPRSGARASSTFEIQPESVVLRVAVGAVLGDRRRPARRAGARAGSARAGSCPGGRAPPGRARSARRRARSDQPLRSGARLLPRARPGVRRLHRRAARARPLRAGVDPPARGRSRDGDGDRRRRCGLLSRSRNADRACGLDPRAGRRGPNRASSRPRGAALSRRRKGSFGWACARAWWHRSSSAPARSVRSRSAAPLPTRSGRTRSSSSPCSDASSQPRCRTSGRTRRSGRPWRSYVGSRLSAPTSSRSSRTSSEARWRPCSDRRERSRLAGESCETISEPPSWR